MDSINEQTSRKHVLNQSLFSISWPIFIDIFLHFATLIINTFMVLKISKEMVGSMTVGNQIFEVFITIFNFISVGSSVVIAQYLGARKEHVTHKIIHMAFGFNFLISICVFIIIFFFGQVILQKMNTPANLLEDSYNYLHILAICLIPESIILILAATLRVYGRSRIAMYVSLLVNLITIVLNMIVLYGWFGFPKLGVVGVAWSTTIGRMIGVLLLIFFLIRIIKINLSFIKCFLWERFILKQIFKIGLPSAGEALCWNLQMLIIITFINKIGSTALAAHNVFFQIDLFIMLFGISISVGNEIFVGHLVGAQAYKKAYKKTLKTLKMGMVATLLIALSFYFFSEKIMGLISSNDQSITENVLPLFLLCIFLEPCRTVNIVLVNALKASGDTIFPLITAIIFMWFVSIPVGYFLGIYLKMGLLGIWIGFLCDEAARGLTHFLRWKSRKWQTKRLITSHE